MVFVLLVLVVCNLMVHSGQILLNRLSYMVIKCANCEFIHVVDRDFLPYKPSQFNTLYKSRFYEEEKPNYIEDVSRDKY